jgi:hypothetical protein
MGGASGLKVEPTMSDLGWVGRLQGAEHLLERIAGIEALRAKAGALRENHHVRGPEMVARLCAEAIHLEAQAESLVRHLLDEIMTTWSAEEIEAALVPQPA